MPRYSGARTNKVEIIEPSQMIKCDICKKNKLPEEFYVSRLERDKETGRYPICKECIKRESLAKNGLFISLPNLAKMLKMLDKPYVSSWWDSHPGAKPNYMGQYFKFLGMKDRTECLTWEDGDLDALYGKLTDYKENVKQNLENQMEAEKEKIFVQDPKKKKNKKREKREDTMSEMPNDFKVTDEMISLFGTGYTDEEYYLMWTKYQFLSANYSEQTNMHTEALVTYVRYKVKEEMAVAANKASDAKTWGELAMKQAERAKINPNQLTKADLQGGLSTIGEIAQAVEQNVDIIPILPQFRYRPNDAVDFCIWNYINYARALENKPLISYEDVYSFYDKMKDEYIASTGDPYHLFDKDPTTDNREKVKQFIKLPESYYEEDDK